MTYRNALVLVNYAKNKNNFKDLCKHAMYECEYDEIDTLSEEELVLRSFISICNKGCEYIRKIPKFRTIPIEMKFPGKDNILKLNCELKPDIILPASKLGLTLEPTAPIDYNHHDNYHVFQNNIYESQISVKASKECIICADEACDHLYVCPYCHLTICMSCLEDYIENVMDKDKCLCPGNCEHTLDITQLSIHNENNHFDSIISKIMLASIHKHSDSLTVEKNLYIQADTIINTYKDRLTQFDTHIAREATLHTSEYNKLQEDDFAKYCNKVTSHEILALFKPGLTSIYSFGEDCINYIIKSNEMFSKNELFIHTPVAVFEHYVKRITDNGDQTKNVLMQTLLFMEIYKVLFIIYLDNTTKNAIDIFDTDNLDILNDVNSMSDSEHLLTKQIAETLKIIVHPFKKLHFILDSTYNYYTNTGYTMSIPVATFVKSTLENMLMDYKFTDEIFLWKFVNNTTLKQVISVIPDSCYCNIENYYRILTKIVDTLKATTIYIARCQHCDNGLCDTNGVCNKCSYKLCDVCNVSYDPHEKHTCNKADIETFRIIKDRTRVCPWCFNRIERLRGCNDMFCNNCHHMFRYDTGEKIYNERENPEQTDFRNHAGIFAKAAFDIDLKFITEYIKSHLAVSVKALDNYDQIMKLFDEAQCEKIYNAIKFLEIPPIFKDRISTTKCERPYTELDNFYNFCSNLNTALTNMCDNTIVGARNKLTAVFNKLMKNIEVYGLGLAVYESVDAHYTHFYNILHKLQVIAIKEKDFNKVKNTVVVLMEDFNDCMKSIYTLYKNIINFIVSTYPYKPVEKPVDWARLVE